MRKVSNLQDGSFTSSQSVLGNCFPQDVCHSLWEPESINALQMKETDLLLLFIPILSAVIPGSAPPAVPNIPTTGLLPCPSNSSTAPTDTLSSRFNLKYTIRIKMDFTSMPNLISVTQTPLSDLLQTGGCHKWNKNT